MNELLAEPIRKVVVCGDRDWTDFDMIRRALIGLRGLYGPHMMVLTNGQAGAEALAQRAANELHLASHVYRPHYHLHAKAALLRAHKEMLDLNPDVGVLLVFEEKTRRETRDMILRCERVGIPWQVIRKEVIIRA